MHLSECLQNLSGPAFELNQSEFNVEIQGISLDSRQVTMGSLFCAYPGVQQDGRNYLAMAIEKGARVILYQPGKGAWLNALSTLSFEVQNFFSENQQGWLPGFVDAIFALPIDKLNTKISQIAANYFQHPSACLHLIGVTGTNGKSSICHLLAQAFSRHQQSCGVAGTLGNGVFPNLQKTGLTTADPISLQAFCRQLVEQHVATLAMEISSHALDQGRVSGLNVNIGIFTNLTPDHLDYHQTMAAYGQAKLKLFTEYPLEVAILNANSTFSVTILDALPKSVQIYLYGVEVESAKVSSQFDSIDILAKILSMSREGTKAWVKTPWGEGQLTTRLLGQYNLSNMLAVIATLGVYGMPWVEIVNVCADLQAPSGRLECFGGKQGRPLVVVDYAHTPDALAQILKCLREVCTGQLICVFGCGGDRDRTKRAKMGLVASQYAEKIIVTNDNPRSEDPEQIVEEILSGMQNSAAVKVELSRAKAIEMAILQAKPEDIILCAGKGHETEQIIGKEVLAFSDQEVVLNALASSLF